MGQIEESNIPEYDHRFTLERIYSIDDYYFDGLIVQEYGFKDFTCSLDQSNGTNLKIHVDGNFDKWGQDRLDDYLKTGDQDYSTVRLLLNDLCRKGKISSGTYLIEISW